MSALRAKCPDCRTLTAVAIGPEYQCHSCGREFAAGLVRVPRACGDCGEELAAAAALTVPWPEAAVIEEETLEAQIEAMARELPARPVVLGGCPCSHAGAVRELSRRYGRIGVVWFAAPGNPSTQALQLLAVAPGDVTVIDSQNPVVPRPGDLPEHVYVAVDAGAADSVELEVLLASIPRPVGAGFSGFLPSARNEAELPRLGHALGL